MELLGAGVYLATCYHLTIGHQMQNTQIMTATDINAEHMCEDRNGLGNVIMQIIYALAGQQVLLLQCLRIEQIRQLKVHSATKTLRGSRRKSWILEYISHKKIK